MASSLVNNLLSKNPYLIINLPFIFASFLLITTLSWLTYYLIAPRLITRYYRKIYQKQGSRRMSGDFLKYGAMRIKWPHMCMSLFHAVVVAVMAIWYIWIDVDGLSSDPINGYSQKMASVMSFSTG